MSKVPFIQKVYEAFGQGDMPRFFSYLSPEIAWYPAEGHPYAPQGRPWVGQKQLAKEFFGKVGEEWSSFQCLPAKFHDAGEHVIVEGRYSGRHKSGKSLDSQFCHIWTVGEDGVTAFRQYTDTAQLQAVVAG